MSKVNYKNTRMTWLTLFWCFYCSLWTHFTSFSYVSIVYFEHVNVSWVMFLFLTLNIYFIFLLQRRIQNLLKIQRFTNIVNSGKISKKVKNMKNLYKKWNVKLTLLSSSCSSRPTGERDLGGVFDWTGERGGGSCTWVAGAVLFFLRERRTEIKTHQFLKRFLK